MDWPTAAARTIGKCAGCSPVRAGHSRACQGASPTVGGPVGGPVASPRRKIETPPTMNAGSHTAVT